MTDRFFVVHIVRTKLLASMRLLSASGPRSSSAKKAVDQKTYGPTKSVFYEHTVAFVSDRSAPRLFYSSIQKEC